MKKIVRLLAHAIVWLFIIYGIYLLYFCDDWHKGFLACMFALLSQIWLDVDAIKEDQKNKWG